MVTGTSVTYISGTSHRPLPKHDDPAVRRTHEPARPKPTGLDWDAITPACTGCGQKSGQLGDGGLCPTCRGVQPVQPRTTKRGKKARAREEAYPQLPEDELLRRFTGPDDTRLGRALTELEAEDPKVAAAAERLTDAVARAVLPEDHVVPEHLDAVDTDPTPEDVVDNVTELPQRYTDAANLDAQVAHAERVLRATVHLDDPAARRLRLTAISAIEALHLYVEMHLGGYTHQPPAPATCPRPAGAGPTSAEPNPPGLGGARRPAARTEGEAGARPATKRPSQLDPHRDELIAAYLNGDSTITLGARYGVSDVSVRYYLRRESVPLRTRSQAQKAHRNRTTTPTGDTTA